MTIGEALKKIRNRSRLSAREFAEEVGVNQYRLQKWEDGSANPKYDDMQIIMKFLGISTTENLSEEVINIALRKILQKKNPNLYDTRDEDLPQELSDLHIPIQEKEKEIKQEIHNELSEYISHLKESIALMRQVIAEKNATIEDNRFSITNLRFLIEHLGNKKNHPTADTM